MQRNENRTMREEQKKKRINQRKEVKENAHTQQQSKKKKKNCEESSPLEKPKGWNFISMSLGDWTKFKVLFGIIMLWWDYPRLLVCWGKVFHIKIGKICKCLLERIFFSLQFALSGRFLLMVMAVVMLAGIWHLAHGFEYICAYVVAYDVLGTVKCSSFRLIRTDAENENRAHRGAPFVADAAHKLYIYNGVCENSELYRRHFEANKHITHTIRIQLHILEVATFETTTLYECVMRMLYAVYDSVAKCCGIQNVLYVTYVGLNCCLLL